MTKIVKLLDDKAAQEFVNLMYEDGGLMELLPVWLTFDDVALECIAVLVILEQRFDLDNIGKNKLYRLYTAVLGFIAEKYGEAEFLCGSYFTKKSFFRFMNTYFPGWDCKKPLHNQ